MVTLQGKIDLLLGVEQSTLVRSRHVYGVKKNETGEMGHRVIDRHGIRLQVGAPEGDHRQIT